MLFSLARAHTKLCTLKLYCSSICCAKSTFIWQCWLYKWANNTYSSRYLHHTAHYNLKQQSGKRWLTVIRTTTFKHIDAKKNWKQLQILSTLNLFIFFGDLEIKIEIIWYRGEKDIWEVSWQNWKNWNYQKKIKLAT